MKRRSKFYIKYAVTFWPTFLNAYPNLEQTHRDPANVACSSK